MVGQHFFFHISDNFSCFFTFTCFKAHQSSQPNNIVLVYHLDALHYQTSKLPTSSPGPSTRSFFGNTLRFQLTCIPVYTLYTHTHADAYVCVYVCSVYTVYVYACVYTHIYVCGYVYIRGGGENDSEINRD